MTKFDAFLWWSGAGVWLVMGTIAMLSALEQFIEWTLGRLRMKREFLAFVYERLVKRRGGDLG